MKLPIFHYFNKKITLASFHMLAARMLRQVGLVSGGHQVGRSGV